MVSPHADSAVASAGVAAAVLAAAGPALATATSVEERRDLDLFQSWLRSPVTAAMLATVWSIVALERVLDDAERSGGGYGPVDAPRG